MSDKMIQFTKPQKCRFDFGTDNKLYVVLFHGKITWKETAEMLASLQNCSYEKMHRAIPLYLKKHHLEYSDFVSVELPLENKNVIGWAKYPLHSDICNKINEMLKDTDIFCSVVDYQQTAPDGSTNGCYLAVKKIFTADKRCKYHMIGQTFAFDKRYYDERGYFAIRTNNENSRLRDIDTSAGEPVLPTFGCVDLISLLQNMDNLHTAEQVTETAFRGIEL